MKVGIDCRLINKVQNTGISRYTEFLIGYYISRFEQNCIYLITNDCQFKFESCNIVYTRLRPYRILDFLRFTRLINSLNIDLYHSPFYSGTNSPNKSFKSLVTVHDLMFQILPDFFSENKLLNYIKLVYFKVIVRQTLSSADKIICVSDTTKNDVLKEYRVSSVHIPENSEILSDVDPGILIKHNLREKGFYLYCGNNRRHKNLPFIINIFNSSPELPRLVLAGHGHADSVNVLNVGVISDAELKALYQASIAFIFASQYEGFGLPILEALRSETFVVASRIPAFLEFKSNNIFYFSLGNKPEFVSALYKTLDAQFDSDSTLFAQYSEEKIFTLLDNTLEDISITSKQRL